jgi:sugar phosphate isomerase/epimerase
MHATDRTPIGIAHLTALDVPPAELVGMAARTGYASVGLRLFAAYPGAPVYSLPPGSAALRDLLDRLDATGVRVHDIETITLDAEFSLDGVSQVFESGAALGARRVTVSGDDPDAGRLVANYAALCDLAAPFGLGVDIENLGWRRVATFADALALAQAAARPNAGVLVDALHFFRNGGRPADLAAVPPGLLRCAQLCDAPAAAPTTRDGLVAEARGGRMAPGAGALDLRALVASLPEGTALSLEVPTGEGLPAETLLARLMAATRAFLSAGPPG